MRMYLVRHGQSEGNISRPDAPHDPGLTELGLSQANLVPSALKGEPLFALYASPMRRALQTAEPIGRAFDLPALVRPKLCETSRREWNMPERVGKRKKSGLSMSEVKQDFPDAVTPQGLADEDPWWEMLDGEGRSQAYARATDALNSLKNAHPGSDETIVVVTHGAFGSVLMSTALSSPPTDYNRYGQYNCGISFLGITPEDTRLRYLNSAEHLPLALRTDLT